MTKKALPAFIQENYEVHEWRHACAILQKDFPQEWHDIIEVLAEFRFSKTQVLKPGGRKTEISASLDSEFTNRGWKEVSINTKFIVDEEERDTRTHQIDCYKNNIGLEIEWNSKDQTFIRDLNNFRILFELRRLSVGIIITRCDNLQTLFQGLGVGKKYGASTTHMSKLLPHIKAGGGGGCPLLVFGITSKLYEG